MAIPRRSFSLMEVIMRLPQATGWRSTSRVTPAIASPAMSSDLARRGQPELDQRLLPNAGGSAG